VRTHGDKSETDGAGGIACPFSLSDGILRESCDAHLDAYLTSELADPDRPPSAARIHEDGSWYSGDFALGIRSRPVPCCAQRK